MSFVRSPPFGAQFKLVFLARSSRLGVSCRRGLGLSALSSSGDVPKKMECVQWVDGGGVGVGFLVSHPLMVTACGDLLSAP